MAKSNKMDDLFAKRSPSVMRAVPIKPVRIIEEATQIHEREDRTDQPTQNPIGKPDEAGQSVIPNEKPDELSGTTIPNGKPNEQTPSLIAPEKPDEQKLEKKPSALSATKKRSSQPHNKSERNIRTKKPRMYSERDIQELLAVEKRELVRYSFEAYADQRDDIQHVCDLYKERTGNYLSASRLLRELLDSFLPGAIKAFEDSER